MFNHSSLQSVASSRVNKFQLHFWNLLFLSLVLCFNFVCNWLEAVFIGSHFNHINHHIKVGYPEFSIGVVLQLELFLRSVSM